MSQQAVQKFGLPPAIKIAFQTFEVVDATTALEKEGHWGEIDYETSTINLSTKPQTHISHTLLHEILHGIGHIFLNGQGLTDTQIEGLSSGLATVFVDNPEFVAWLLSVYGPAPGIPRNDVEPS